MREFFKGWRRKVGMTTLGLVCLLMAAWHRSYETIDSIYRPISGRKGGCCVVQSEKGTIHWYSTGQVWHDEKLLSLTPYSQSVASSSNILTSDEAHWSVKYLGFAIGEVEPPPVARGRPNRTVWIIPYWSIILTLALLSAYLILWKPRAKDKPDA